MTVEVLFTVDMDNWKQGAEHLTHGGIWLRQFTEDGKRKAHLCCLDKLTLAEFADLFELTKFERDVEMYGYGWYLRTFRVIVWGSKLEQILEWRRQTVQQDTEGSEGLQGS